MSSNENDIEVSVVCMAYNQEDYIEQCLESLAMQKTSFRYEVVVHDDASTDSTADRIRRLANKYSSIVPIFQSENQFSQGKNIRKLIMPYVRGRFIAVCEGDDWWCDENKLQTQYDLLNAHPDIVACAHAVKLYSEDRKGLNGTLAPRSTECDVSTGEIIREIAPFGTNSLFFKSEYYLMPPEYMGWGVGDYPLCIWLSVNGRFVYLPREMAVYRMHAKGSWSQRMMKNTDYALRQNALIVDGLTHFDAATNGEYSGAVHSAILDYRISSMVLQRDLKGLLSGECRERIAQYPLRRQLSTFVKCFAPRLFSLIDRYRPRG